MELRESVMSHDCNVQGCHTTVFCFTTKPSNIMDAKSHGHQHSEVQRTVVVGTLCCDLMTSRMKIMKNCRIHQHRNT